MELKYIFSFLILRSGKFKLYLYGIEILCFEKMILVIGLFKLYLYGIEIGKG